MLPGLLSAALLLLPLPQIDPGTQQSQLRGHVVGASGGPIPATIRLIDPGTKAVVLRFRAKEDGTFETGPLKPSVYALTAFAQGFRRRELRKVVIEPGHITDLGEIALDFSGCDMPGMICDYFGEVPEDVRRIIAQSHVTLPRCAVDLDREGVKTCPERDNAGPGVRDSDLRLAKENGTLYLVAMNGAALSTPYVATSDCSGIAYGSKRIAIAGLGPGVDFCVRTKRGSVSHVFFTDDVGNESTTVTLWFVTRKRR